MRVPFILRYLLSRLNSLFICFNFRHFINFNSCAVLSVNKNFEKDRIEPQIFSPRF